MPWIPPRELRRVRIHPCLSTMRCADSSDERIRPSQRHVYTELGDAVVMQELVKRVIIELFVDGFDDGSA